MPKGKHERVCRLRLQVVLHRLMDLPEKMLCNTDRDLLHRAVTQAILRANQIDVSNIDEEEQAYRHRIHSLHH